MRAATRQHTEALERGPSHHRIIYWNAFGRSPSALGLGAFDVVVLHTTLLCLRWFEDFARWRNKLRWVAKLDCLKVALPQDEYDHSEILDEWLEDWGVHHVFSNFDEGVRPLLYPRMASRAQFHHAFTGYIDEPTASRLADTPSPLAGRPFDVVYRASRLPFWFGSLGQLKHLIGDKARQQADARKLLVDISTRPEDAILGDGWFDFLASGRAVIGSESGSSVLDRRGEIKARIVAILHEHPTATFDEVAEHLPAGWDSYNFAAVSPRHFEAVISRTCQVLVRGRYDDVFEAGRHYIPVQADLADLGDALERAADPAVAAEFVDRAYEEIYRSGSYSYGRLAEDLDRVLDTRPPRRSVSAPMVAAVAERIGERGLKQSPGLEAAWGELSEAPLASQRRQVAKLMMRRRGAQLLLATMRGRVGRRLLGAYLASGGDSVISAEMLLREARLLDTLVKAQRRPPWNPGSRVIQASYDDSALEFRVLLRASPGTQPAVAERWPPRSIVVRGLTFPGLPTTPAGLGNQPAITLAALTALAADRPRDARLAVDGLLDYLGGARSRPQLTGLRSWLLRQVALARVLLARPSYLGVLVAAGLARIPLADMSDDLLKLAHLKRLTEGNKTVAASWRVDADGETLYFVTGATIPRGPGSLISTALGAKRLIWDHSAIAGHVLVPVALGRRLTLYLGSAGVHEFTGLEALPRPARNVALRGL